MKDTLAYVGTYTKAQSKGIYVFRVQSQGSGASAESVLVPLGLAAETENPSYLAIDPRRRVVFAVNENNTFEGKPSGAVSAFAIDPATGKLTLLNQRATLGTAPCHLVLDRTGRNLLVANYSSGSVVVLPVLPDGHLGEPTDFVQHAGKSIHPTRQTGPHAHGFALDAANRFAFVCDLGLDQILTYRFDAEHGKLTPGNPAFTPVKPGSGPRHIVFRPDGRFAYVINELSSTITVFAYDAEHGRLTEAQTISTLPPGFAGKSTCAEIAVAPSGKFLYGSNRGSDTLAVFAINPADGTLTSVEAHSTGGKTPRHFVLDPTGTGLFTANQDTNTIQANRIDPATGRLTPTGALVEVSLPVCIEFFTPTTPSTP